MSGNALLLGVDVPPPASGSGPPTANLVMWLKADAESYGNGASVAAWHDQSGNGNDMTQGTGANQPTYATGIVNGLAALSFPSGKGMLSALSLTKPYTIFWVEQSTDRASVTGHSFSRSVCSSTANCLVSIRRGDGNSAYVQGNVASYTPDDLSPHIGTLRIGATAAAYRVDGADHTAHTSQVADWGTVALGTSGEFGESVLGYLAEVLVYNAALSDADMASVESYLSSKYAITI